MTKLNFIYSGGASRRFHTCQILKEQDISAHSFGVAWCCELLTDGGASKSLIMAALVHDLAEHVVGDIPSPSKRAMGVSEMFHIRELGVLQENGLGHYYDNLTMGDELTLKVADMIDGMMFCLREFSFGNRHLIPVYGNFKKYALEVIDKPRTSEAELVWGFRKDLALELINEIDNQVKGLI